ncbi:hypothetical protein [Streptomyces sp. NPDC048111]|uniref:hypothetical protein n=1 Tax=Streptomyces sp. NPDC048111 TaxID=3365500 RepID=UPI0037164598
MLRAALSDGRARPGRALLLHGPAGVGKSALAAHLVARWDSGSDWPVCWVPPGGDRPDPTTSLLRMLSQLDPQATQLRHPAGDPTAGPGTVRDACRRHFASFPALVVFDDVPSAEVARTLLAAFEDTHVRLVLTAREPLTALTDHEVRRHEVRPLDVHDAAVLSWRAGSTLLTGADAEALWRITDGLPLLLRLVGPLLEGDAGPRELRRMLPRALGRRTAALAALALDRLSDTCRASVRRLDLYGPVPFSADTAAALSYTGDTGWIKELDDAGLLVPAYDGRWTVPPAVRAAAAKYRPVSGKGLAAAACEDLLGVLDGEARQATRRQVSRCLDEYLDLALVLPAVREVLLEPLGRLLAVRCDGYRLTALRRAVPADRTDLRERLDRAVREPEIPSGTLSAEAARRLRRASSAHEAGELRAALQELGPDPAQDPEAWAATETLRAQILSDQGRAAAADHAFTAAAELHGDLKRDRPRAWTTLHHAGLLLRTGRPRAARAAAERAGAVFRAIGDLRGLAWCATVLGRARLATENSAVGLVELRAAKALHERSGDLRGLAWTRYHLALGLADRDSQTEAVGELTAALDLFEALPDRFGTAWSMHQLALLERDSGEAPGLLRDAAEHFRWIDCPHGLAWTELALAGHPTVSPYHELGKAQKAGHLHEARALFATLGDEHGELWARFCLHLLDGDGDGVDAVLAELAQEEFGACEDARLLQTHRRRGRRSPSWHFDVPRRARDTIRAVPQEEAPQACRVRLTLLDGPPTRILLRVEAGRDHPWATASGRPVWLRAVATPLTPADAEPAVCLVRPSPLAAHGAEFTVTGHRPGLHRLRFTLTDDRTGTVLQQVETEFDLPDTSTPRPATAPRPARVRGA